MLKKKAFNRIFITTIVFFIVFTLYNLKIVASDAISQETIESKKETIYTLNSKNYISKTEVYVGKVLTLKDKIKEKLEIMIAENDKNALLPSYFKPILPENTKVLKVEVEDSLVKVYFSKELNNISEEQSEKMIEAIVYTITDENILGIEIYVEGELLKYVPHTKKELPTILTKEFGINKTYALINTNDIVKIVMTYFIDCNNEYVEVPVTKYLNDNREKLEIIFDNLTFDPSNSDLISLVDNVKLVDYKIKNDTITIYIDRDISFEEENLIVSSIVNNYDAKKVIILANNQKKLAKTIEK